MTKKKYNKILFYTLTAAAAAAAQSADFYIIEKVQREKERGREIEGGRSCVAPVDFYVGRLYKDNKFLKRQQALD